MLPVPYLKILRRIDPPKEKIRQRRTNQLTMNSTKGPFGLLQRWYFVGHLKF
jgi:hypothetical protein